MDVRPQRHHYKTLRFGYEWHGNKMPPSRKPYVPLRSLLSVALSYAHRYSIYIVSYCWMQVNGCTQCL